MHLRAYLVAGLALVRAAVALPLTPEAGCGVRHFDFTLTWEDHAPDGFSRKMVLINGQFPGPLIEVDEGDVVQVQVTNEMPFNTTVHYHGVEMYDSNWSDGVPGVTQRQIRPGNSFLYQWKATQYGSYWYHAHQRGQLDDGLYGPIMIRPNALRPRPFASLANGDEATLEALLRAERESRPLVLSDYRHVTSDDGWAIEQAAGIETPCYDSVLMNGQGRVDCWSQAKMDSLLSPSQELLLKVANETSLTAKGCLSANIIGNVLGAGVPNNLSAVPPIIFDTCTPTNASLAVIDVVKKPQSPCAPEAPTWVALDVIGAFGLLTGAFSIDGHPLYVYAVDGSYIEPQLVDAIVVTNGDRYSVAFQAGADGDYTIRFACNGAAQMVAGYATLRVTTEQSTTPPAAVTDVQPYINDVGTNTSAAVVFFDQAAMKAFPPDSVATTADRTFRLGIKVAGASYNWALNNSVYPMELDNEDPVLFHPRPMLENNVTITTLAGEWVDLIVQTLTFPMPPHPIHKHGTKMWLIGQGEGTFAYNTVAEALKEIPDSFNLATPPKRDTIATPNGVTTPVWMVLRYQVTNPGAWFMHCHIQSHLLGGMAMVIQDGVDKWPEVPPEYLHYEGF